YPGDATGWMGTRIPSDDQLTSYRSNGTNSFYLYVYPQDQTPFPEIWGMSGRLINFSSSLLYYSMDEFEGQSGSPVYFYEGGTPYVVAINSGGEVTQTGALRNRGARMTDAFDANIDAWSEEY